MIARGRRAMTSRSTTRWRIKLQAPVSHSLYSYIIFVKSMRMPNAMAEAGASRFRGRNGAMTRKEQRTDNGN